MQVSSTGAGEKEVRYYVKVIPSGEVRWEKQFQISNFQFRYL